MKKKRLKPTIFLTKNSRGLSTIVLTLIIIVISLVAVGIVWVVVQNLLNSGSKEVGLGKFTINLDIVRAYEQAGNISVNVKRLSGSGELTKIKFILSDGTNSETVTEDVILDEMKDKTFSIHPTEIAATNVASVSIAPVFNSEGTETTGDIADTYNIISGGIAPEEGQGTGGEGCVPQCGNYQCGTDPVCGQSCGSCGADECVNHVCVPDGCPGIRNSDETTCTGIRCGSKTNNCGESVNCGTCPTGQMCQSGNCVSVTPVNSGTVGETWVSGMYFSSPDLPKETTGLVGYYVSFSGGSSQTSCVMIARWFLPVDTPGYPNSHIGFSFTTQIKTGDTYNIWDNSDKCNANLSLS
jgi:hypothetical protein